MIVELDELVTKIINHIDETAIKTENKIIQEVSQRLEQTKGDIMREVNILLEHQHSQFNTFGEGLDTLNNQVTRSFDEVNKRFDNIDYKLDVLATEQKNIKAQLTELDQEFETKVRLIK